MKSEHTPIVLILILSFMLNVAGITWGLPHYTDWAQDNISLKVLRGAGKLFSGGWYDKYPPFHYFVLSLFYSPYMAYLWLTGGFTSPEKAFPYGFTEPLTAITTLIFIARSVSVIMGVAIVWWVYITVRELFDRRSALFSALMATLYYPLIYYAHNATMEVPYLFWSFLAIYFFLLVIKYGKTKHYAYFALFGMLAICTKDQAYGLFILSPVPILWARYSELDRTGANRRSGVEVVRALFDRRFFTAAGVAILTFILAQNLPLNLSGFLKHVGHVTVRWQPYATYDPTWFGRLQLLWETLFHLGSSLSPPLFVVSLLGAIYSLFRFPKYAIPLIFLAVAYNLTFINVIRYAFLRFTLPLGLILIFFGGKLLADLWSQENRRAMLRPMVALTFAWAAIAAFQVDILFLRDSRYAAEAWIQREIPKGAIVETFAPSYLHLYWYYPRFPLEVKVRNGNIESGLQWEALPIRPDKKRLPNLYMGNEAPDFVVLKTLDTEVLKPEMQALYDTFFEERAGYTHVATFQTKTWVPIHLPMNPRIDIFARR